MSCTESVGCSTGGAAAAVSGGGSAKAAATTVGEDEIDLRLHAIVHRLDCTSDIGWRKVMGYATSEDCLCVFSLVSVAFGGGAASLKRSAEFGDDQLVLADGLIALDRVEAASIRFPKLKEAKVNLGGIFGGALAEKWASQTPAARRSSPSCARLRL